MADDFVKEYDPTLWKVADPITETKMNKIELGIKNAHQYTSSVETLANTAVTNASSALTTAGSANSTAGEALRLVQQATSDVDQGKKAWQYVAEAMRLNSNNEPTLTLDGRLDAIDGGALLTGSSLASRITTLESNLTASTANLQGQIDLAAGVGGVATTLVGKISAIDSNITNAQHDIDSIEEALNAYNVYNRLTALDNNQTLTMNVPQIISEVTTARGLNAQGNSNLALNDRFTTIETAISGHTDDIQYLSDNTVKYTDVKNDFTSSDTNKPISALRGKELRDIIGGTYDPYNVDSAQRTTVTSAIANAGNTAEANAKNYADANKIDKTNIYNDLNYEPAAGATDDKVLDARQGKVLNDRLAAAEGKIEAARTSSVIRTPGANDGDPDTDTTYASLDARLEAIETHAAAVRTDVDTIASELAMVDNENIVATNTRVDTLENDLRTMAAELDMLDGTAIVDTNTRIDDIEGAIDHVHDENDPTDLLPNGLTQRIAVLETTIDTPATGLGARVSTLETTVNNATTGVVATASALSTLSGHVDTLETKDTIVVDKPVSGSNYTNNIPNSTAVETPNANADYLIQADDDKYYYWRYINNSWELISGGGNGEGGGGTSSAAFAASLQAIDNPDINTDYFVGNDTDGYIHYRYINKSGTLTPFIIGVDPDNIKTYNATTSTTGEGDEQITYLDLYEFDYGANNTVIDPQASTLRAHIPLPKGGGGSNNNITARLVRIGEETIPVTVNSKVNLYVFFSAWDSDQSYSGNYTLKYNNTTIKTDIFASGAVNATPINWVVVEEPEFNNDVPVISSPDTTKLYIVKTGNTFTQWTYTSGSWSSVEGAPAGFYALDISDYCKTASINNTFALTVTYGIDNTPIGKTWKVNVYDLYIESEAPETLLISSTTSYGFVYTAFGALDKTLHVLIDNHQVGTKNLSSSTSGRPDTFTITPTMIQNAVGYIHGVHKIEMYLTKNIGGITRTTSRITRDYIWYDTTDTETPIIIASPYRGQTLDVQQYSTLSIPYQVYQKDTDTIEVKYYLDNVLVDEVHLNKVNKDTFNYVVTADAGTHTIKIAVEEEYIQVTLNVTEMTNVNISPIDGAIIDFDPSTLSNSSINRLPSWTVDQTTYRFTASSNFNWSDDINGGGYKTDSNGEKCFVIKAGSYIDLNYPMFGNNVFSNGSEMKIAFKTAAVRNAEAVWYKNIGEISGKTVGIQLNAHNGWLKTDKAVSTTTIADEDSDEDTITVKGVTYTYWKTNTAYNVNDIRVIRNIIYRCTGAADALATNLQDKSVDLDEDPAKSYLKKWLKIGQLDTEVLATNSYLYFPYSEEDKIELDININKSSANNNFIMSYEDGVPSKAYAYTTGAGGDKITHNGTIRIGSDDCDVYIYRLRYYTEALTTDQILQNFIADGATIDEKINRYNRNCIYWDSTQERYFTSPSLTASLDPVKLAERMPDVKILMLETPTFTTGKKDFVQGSTLRCLHASGGKLYESRGDADNWFFRNGFHAGQGTTSDNYGQAGRNVDFLFEVDGIHYPTKAKNMNNYSPSNSYVSNVLIGEDASEWVETAQNSGVYHWVAAREPEETEVCSDWMEDNCKVSLTETSVPNNYFNLKVNIASSENVNNALFQKRYNEFLVYHSPAQAAQVAKHQDTYENIEDIIVKNSMEFVPAVLFVRETGVDINGNAVARNEFKDDKWHFYALGNMGDSKKSDYTRAYDPDDMNEFTCENSDNNTNNGQFQSGVFTYQGHAGAIETDYSAWNETTAYEVNAIVVYNGMVYTRTGTSQAALGENETYSWVAADWTAITYTGWTDQDPPYFAPRTNPNPMEYTYPITPSQWNVKLGDNYLNRKHMTLATEKFDGDHSFEFRYACRGDYRDGDLINDTNGNSEILNDPSDVSKGYRTKDDVQFDINHDVMLAMYEWLITATPAQYENEASQWFVKSAMEFFYAYTHYYTMTDNRAKNTFWHFAKTGTYIEVSRPVKELLHVYEESTDNGVTWSAATGTTIDPNKKYRTQYAFDLWVYDCDTAAGIDNNGALVFPYGKEDEDYRVDGEPSSGYAFNGAGSIFWRRLKTTFADEIAQVMDSADKKCFNSEDLIKEFDDFQNCFPEEVWRLDIERKYIRTYTGASIDNSITEGKQNARFLMSMMHGRKKYQRRQWIRDQGFYFNSKYNIGDISTNRTEFNIVSPAGDHSLLAVQPDYHLRLTPYQDMYLNVVVGNGTPIPPIRAKANQEYTIKLDDYAAGNFDETRVYIGGFKMISKLGGLAPMYPYSFTLNGLNHLKELDIGTNNSGYRNGNFTELPLTNEVNLPLLEKLNIQNCNALTTSIGLKTANNLRIVEAVGSSIGGISLPEYTQIETLHLPSTVTDIILHGARFLKDFIVADRNGTANYSNIYTLDIKDSDYSINFKEDPSDPLPINWISIAIDVLEKQSPQTDLSITGLYSATINDIQDLEPIADAKEIIEAVDGQVNLEGIIHVTGEWSTVEKDYYGKPNGIWPNLEFDVTTGTEIVRYKIIYKYDDSTKNGQEIYSTYISPTLGDQYITIPEIYNNRPGETSILSTVPSKDSTKEYQYQFGTIGANTYYTPYSGWRLHGSDTILTAQTANLDINVLGETRVIIVEAVFTRSNRSYPVYWYLNEGDTIAAYTSGVNVVEYGKTYDGHIPTVQDLNSSGKILYTMQAGTGVNTLTYKIFDGWLTAPINLTLTDAEAAQQTPHYSIYAKWRTGTNVPITTIRDTEGFTPEKLLLFSQYENQRTSEYFSTNKHYDISMGYDGVDGGTQLVPRLIGGNNIIDIFDGSVSPRNTSITPLAAQDNAFTLVIDYKFDTSYNYTDTVREAVLVGCYEKVNNAIYGFRLYYDPGYNDTTPCVKVGFGDTSQAGQSKIISDAKATQYRNIIVLRHKQDDPLLYVYSGIRYNERGGLNNNSNMEIFSNLDADGVFQTISWNNVITNAQLRIGGLTSGTTDTNDIVDAHGTIYWAKYWNQDLGDGECRKLISWPHETITFGVEDYAGMPGGRIIPSITGVSQPNIVLTSLSSSSYIGPVYKTLQSENYSNGTYVSWSNSWYRTFSNNRIFYGLPTTLQSILSKTTNMSKQLLNDNGVFKFQESSLVNTADYIFMPSYAEVDRTRSVYNNEANKPYTWIIDSRVITYQYLDNSFSTEGSTSNSRKFMNLRFPYIAMTKNQNRIFINYSGNTAVYNLIPNISRGDIFIRGSDNIAFIYVTGDDINNGAPVLPNSGIFACTTGGWIRAENWWLRSVFDGDITQPSQGAQLWLKANGVVSDLDYHSKPSALPNYNNSNKELLTTNAAGACICYSFGV